LTLSNGRPCPDGALGVHAEPITVSATPPAPVLDEFGNVKGGWRAPYLDVPTSTWLASSTNPPGSTFSGIAGHEVPFSAERLAALYRPSHRPRGRPRRSGFACQASALLRRRSPSATLLIRT